MATDASAIPESSAERLKAILANAFKRLDRLPALNNLLERAAILCTESMRGNGQLPPEVSLRETQACTAQELLDEHEGVSAIGVLHAPQWNTRLLLCANRNCVFQVVEMLLGGDGAPSPYDEERGYSTIELGLIRIMFERLAAALEAAFGPVVKTAFDVEGTSDRIDLDILGGRNSTLIIARFGLQANGRQGDLVLVMPSAAIDALRPALARSEAAQAKKPDAGWSSQMQNEITRTSVTVSAVLDERLAALEEIRDLKIGGILPLEATPRSRVRIECYGEPLFWCQLGKSNGRYTLRVEEVVDKDQEFMKEILGG
jgi:flagellar motor switch protein FliM